MLSLFDRFFLQIPRWAKNLQEPIRPNLDQIRRLEKIRKEIGVSHDEFFFHILSHPEIVKKLQWWVYDMHKQEHPEWAELELRMSIIASRLKSAMDNGMDIFVLSEVEESQLEDKIRAIAEKYQTVDELSEAFVREAGPYIPTKPEFEEPVHRIKLILQENSRKIVEEAAYKHTCEILNSDVNWRKFPTKHLNAIAKKLCMTNKIKDFVILCEETEIINRLLESCKNDVEKEDADYFLGRIASMLTSYANNIGNQKLFDKAQQVLKITLLLKQRFVPAWGSMAVAAMCLGDCDSAVYWADRVLSFKAEPTSQDSWEKSFEAEGDEIIEEVLKSPDHIKILKEKNLVGEFTSLVGAHKGFIQHMIEIKEKCSK